MFTYVPDRNLKRTSETTILEAKFGDGYVQRATEGINARHSTWSLQFKNRSATEIDNIESFLISKGGYQPFKWTPPGSSIEYDIICKKWDTTYISPSIKSMTAEFIQVFK